MENKLLNYKIHTNKEDNSFSEDREKVVMIHCFATGTKIFRKQVDELKKNYDLILIDLPSHGESKIKLSNLIVNYSSISNEIIKVLDHLGVKKAHFVGSSLGTLVTKEFLINHPEYVDKSVMVGCVGTWKLAHQFVLAVANFLINTLPYSLSANIVGNVVFPGKVSKDIKHIFIECFKHLEKTEFLSWLKILKQTKKLNLEYLKKIKEEKIDLSKILYITGDQDHIFIPTIKHELEKIKNTYLIKDCGHICNYDKPHKVNNLILSFLTPQILNLQKAI